MNSMRPLLNICIQQEPSCIVRLKKVLKSYVLYLSIFAHVLQKTPAKFAILIWLGFKIGVAFTWKWISRTKLALQKVSDGDLAKK